MKKKLKPCEINHLLFDKFRKTNYKNQVDSVSRVSKSIKEKNILISKEISKEKIFLIEKILSNSFHEKNQAKRIQVRETGVM